MYGKVNDKIDVYAYGVVLLEHLSGRKLISNDYPKGKRVWLCGPFKISEDALSLLQSTKTIGQAETKLEKRKGDMHLLKAGMEVHLADQPLKTKYVDTDFETQLDSDNAQLSHHDFLERQVMSDTPVSVGSSQKPVFSSYLTINGESYASLLVEEVSNRDGSTATQEDMKT